MVGDRTLTEAVDSRDLHRTDAGHGPAQLHQVIRVSLQPLGTFSGRIADDEHQLVGLTFKFIPNLSISKLTHPILIAFDDSGADALEPFAHTLA